MKKYFLLLTFGIAASLGAMKESNPSLVEALSQQAAQIVASKAHKIYAKKIEEILDANRELTPEDLTPEMRESAFIAMEKFLALLPTELKLREFIAAFINTLERADIFADHLVHFYRGSKVKLGRPSKFIDYYMNFCEPAQAKLMEEPLV